jgi:hypothetical protein
MAPLHIIVLSVPQAIFTTSIKLCVSVNVLRQTSWITPYCSAGHVCLDRSATQVHVANAIVPAQHAMA